MFAVFSGDSRIRSIPVDIAPGVNVALQKLRCYNGIMNKNSVHDLSDGQLIDNLKAAASDERAATAHLVELLAEVDARKLYLGQGYSSLFVYCARCLQLSEHAAYGRIEAARSIPVIRPLAPERYKVQLTISRETHDKLRRVQDLLRHVVSDGDPAMILDRALTLLLDNLERRKVAQVDHPRDGTPSSIRGRHVPAEVRRQGPRVLR